MNPKLNQTISQITIIADHREVPSGIPQMLNDLGFDQEITTLKYGDYLINNQIIIERKTKEDFVISLMQQRLFLQIANLRKNANFRPVLLIEGNPYNTKHEITREAVKGALLSISVSWHVPIVFSSDIEDSAQTLALIANQHLKEVFSFYKTGTKPKNMAKKQNNFLQGLPNLGPKLASALLKEFGSIENIILADEKELENINGIGKKKAEKIRRFFSNQLTNKIKHAPKAYNPPN